MGSSGSVLVSVLADVEFIGVVIGVGSGVTVVVLLGVVGAVCIAGLVGIGTGIEDSTVAVLGEPGVTVIASGVVADGVVDCA